MTLDTLNKISAKLYKTGKIEKKDLPPEFLARCTSADRIVEEIERENAKLLKEMLAMDGSRRAAVDYAVFARVLSEALEKNDAEYRPDEAGRAAAAHRLFGGQHRRIRRAEKERLCLPHRRRRDEMHCRQDYRGAVRRARRRI